MEKLKTAIIGLQHLHPVSYLPHIIACNLDLIAISDDNKSLLEKRKTDFPSNVKYYSDYKNLIDSEKIDIVFIFSPLYQCPDVVEHAACKGINIIIEKPMAASYEGGLKIQKACTKNNVISSIPYVWRFHFASREIKRILDSGYLGEIKALEGRYIAGRINRYIEADSSWVIEKKKSGGGAMWNLCSHWIDLFRYFMNFPKAERVYAEYSNISDNIDVEENASGIIKFSNGAVATLNAGYTLPTSFPNGRDLHINIRGSLGSLTWNPVFEGSEDEVILCSDHPDINIAPNRHIRVILKNVTGYFGIMGFEFVKEFVDSIQTKTKPLVSTKEAVEVLQITEALNKSAETGSAIKIEELS